MNQRKKKVLLKGFEQHFALLSFLTVIAILMLMIALVMGLMWMIDPNWVRQADFNDILYVGALGFALLVLTYFYSIRIDRRVSGPMFVLKRNLDRIGDGDLTTEMRLRQQDHLQEISASFNSNIAALRDKVDAVRASAEAISSVATDGEIKPLVDKLMTDLDKIKNRP